MPAAIIASESAFSLSGRLRVSVATRSVSSKRRSSVSVAIARLLAGRHARRRGTIAWPCPLGYEGDNGGHPPRRRGRRRRDARDLRALRTRDRDLLRARAAVGGGVPAPRPERARGGALAPVRGGRQRPGLRLRRALPRATRVPVDGRGDGVRARRSPPQGRRPRPLHVAARLPRAAGFPQRGRCHRAPQPGERGPSRADGFRAGRGAARRRLEARALARRGLVAARARRAGAVAPAAAAAGGAAGERRVAARPRGRRRTRACLGSLGPMGNRLTRLGPVSTVRCTSGGMGHVHVNATIRGTHSMRLRFLVDTGATYNLISPETARRAGIEPGPIRDRMRLATGRAVRVPTGLGAIRIDGREAATIFWIGPCEEPSLRVETLEALGLAVDPAKARLRATRPYATRPGGFGRR